MSRFEYVKFDEFAQGRLEEFKKLVVDIESGIIAIGGTIPEPARGAVVGRSKALAITALEECFMWIGKALRDEQVQKKAESALSS